MGKFQHGNAGGPGGARPGAGRKPEATVLTGRRLFGGLSEEALAAIVAKAVEQAKAGDSTARAWLFDRAIGRPAPADVLAEQEALVKEFDDFRAAVVEALRETSPETLTRVRVRLSEQDEADEVEE